MQPENETHIFIYWYNNPERQTSTFERHRWRFQQAKFIGVDLILNI